MFYSLVSWYIIYFKIICLIMHMCYIHLSGFLYRSGDRLLFPSWRIIRSFGQLRLQLIDLDLRFVTFKFLFENWFFFKIFFSILSFFLTSTILPYVWIILSLEKPQSSESSHRGKWGLEFYMFNDYEVQWWMYKTIRLGRLKSMANTRNM